MKSLTRFITGFVFVAVILFLVTALLEDTFAAFSWTTESKRLYIGAALFCGSLFGSICAADVDEE